MSNDKFDIDEELTPKSRIKGTPRINVITKDEYEDRVEQVFHLLWEVLAKSFGPYGAPTLICNYPWTHVTKDGFTIMKNLSMDTSETLVDQQIADMAADICGRLNYSVGDGTTSAVIATNSIYQSYRAKKEALENLNMLPRDVIKRYDVIKSKIINHLGDHIEKLDLSDRDKLAEVIRKVVYVSSNGDTTITDFIADLYKELGCPAITCSLAPDGITKKNVINGYKFDMSLLDRLYINSDDDVLHLSSADFIIFSTKVREETYEKILKPLNDACRTRGRRLVVAAPNYDEKTLSRSIRRDLNTEWSKTKKINMVLTSYRATSEHARKLVEDFAVLVNTIVIDRPLEQRLLEDISKVVSVESIFNLDSRDGLPDITVGVCPKSQAKDPSPFATHVVKTVDGEVGTEEYIPVPLKEGFIRMGYAEDIDIGLVNTVVRGLYYNPDTYKAIVKESEKSLEETRKKYQKLGTFNLAVTQAEQRYYALNLKMGSIEVGADSELSQKMLKDAVDDSIKAAASAYYHGIVPGDNTILIKIIGQMIDDLRKERSSNQKDIDMILLKILYNGFCDVYKTVLSNAFEDIMIKPCYDLDILENSEFPTVCFTIPTEELVERIDCCVPSRTGEKRFAENDTEVLRVVTDTIIEKFCNAPSSFLGMKKKPMISVHDFIIKYSVVTGQVFDLSTMEFSKDIINSAQTDIEILKATIDLITILIVGNQMVVTQKHNFE